MENEELSWIEVEHREYEKFGLYPYKTLQDIITRLDSGNYKDSNGNALVNSAVFQELEKMAYEPTVPDPVTGAVAAIIHYLEEAGYKDKGGKGLSSSPMILSLKQMNIRKLFRAQSEDGLRLLSTLEGISYQVSEGPVIRRLKDDPAFHDLRRIITLEGREV